MDALLTTEEVARTLRVEIQHVVALILRGELAALELTPGDYRIPPGDLSRFINVRKRNLDGLIAERMIP